MNLPDRTPIDKEIVFKIISESGINSMDIISIRELVGIVNRIEQITGEKYIRMEMGIPGLPPCRVGVQAEIDALNSGVAAKYPMIDGIPELKAEASRFARLFLDIDIPEESCIPSVGSMQGAFATFMVSCRKQSGKTKTLFIDPGFPVQKQQHRILGIPFHSFDVYNFRGNRLRAKLESCLSQGDFSTIVYSNPNNPTWMCLSVQEIEIIGELSMKHDVTVVEDLAYFAMDFRQNYHIPGKPPYQPSVSKFTDNYVILISSSKVFSYAGQRIGVILVADRLFKRNFPDLSRYFSSPFFGHSLVYGALYTLSSGTSHSAQHALAAMLRALNEGKYDIKSELGEYVERAKAMKRIFVENGFEIVYPEDDGQAIADGFYFTFCYPGLSGGELTEMLLYFGVSAISLKITGSDRPDGMRACVSLVDKSQLPILEARLAAFNSHFQNSASQPCVS
ncbi:MAG: pyridoxal phosphate-dependent aminotransferase [Victivallales bacterium]|nr:pyridoxal phosphate-dependent aminotransferase [Victivallales bacterium]